MSLLYSFIIAVSLSMDAFSLALVYGTLNISKKQIITISTTVGIFHFFMPLFGYTFGDTLSHIFSFDADFFIAIIFIFLGLQMLVSIFKNEEVELLTGIFSILLFAFTVSIDSFSVGVGLGVGKERSTLSFLIFSIVSCTFTYLGLRLGSILSSQFGKLSTLIGSIILFLLGILKLF